MHVQMSKSIHLWNLCSVMCLLTAEHGGDLAELLFVHAVYWILQESGSVTGDVWPIFELWTHLCCSGAASVLPSLWCAVSPCSHVLRASPSPPTNQSQLCFVCLPPPFWHLSVACFLSWFSSLFILFLILLKEWSFNSIEHAICLIVNKISQNPILLLEIV